MMIEVKNLIKKYGSKTVLDDVSFTIERGEILGFLGPNGAGKSTTMNIMTGYISSNSGSVSIDGIDILDDATAYKRKIGYLPEIPPLYNDMTVREYLEFVCELKGADKSDIDKIIAEVRIENVYKRLIKNLSKGYRQRVGIAQALVGDPEFLILDEPTVGLDPKQIIEIRNVITGLEKKKTIMISSHILSEISAVCDRVLIINNGKIIAEDTPDNLAANVFGKKKYVVRIDTDEEKALSILEKVDGVEKAECLGENEEDTVDVVITSKDGRDIRKSVSKAVIESGNVIMMFKSANMSLEDIFIALTDKNNSENDGGNS